MTSSDLAITIMVCVIAVCFTISSYFKHKYNNDCLDEDDDNPLYFTETKVTDTIKDVME